MTKILGNLSKGLAFVISAPAGTGKTTLVSMLHQEFPCVVESVSYTTRKPRSYEIPGVHYHFVTEEEFESKIASNELLEYVRLYGYYYGTSKLWIEQQRQAGKHVILVIDTQGALLLKGKFDAAFIFVVPPSIEELQRRLTLRRTEPPEVIEERLAWVKHELEACRFYDYKIINDDLNTAYQVLRSILIAEEHRLIKR